jgi:hypothetical protein
VELARKNWGVRAMQDHRADAAGYRTRVREMQIGSLERAAGAKV